MKELTNRSEIVFLESCIGDPSLVLLYLWCFVSWMLFRHSAIPLLRHPAVSSSVLGHSSIAILKRGRSVYWCYVWEVLRHHRYGSFVNGGDRGY